MKVRIGNIPDEGLEINTSLSLVALNERMSLGRKSDISFVAAPQVQLRIHRIHGGAETKGMIKARYKQPCSLCIKEVERTVELPVNFQLQAKTDRDENSLNPKDHLDDDIGVYYFDGEHIDLEEPLQETLILSLSLFWHPEVLADGKCITCGEVAPAQKGSNSDAPKISLKELLQKAGIK